MFYLILIAVAVAGFLFGRKMAKNSALKRGGEFNFSNVSKNERSDMQEEARDTLLKRTEHRKEKILNFMKEEAFDQEELKLCKIETESIISKRVTSLDIEKLLDVSNDTARKYLNELEDEEKIEQIGDSGRNVYYILKV